MRPLSWSVAMAWAAALWGPVTSFAGEAPFSLRREPGGWTLSQRVPFSVVFLVAGRGTGGTTVYRVHRLEPGGSVSLGWASAAAPATIVAWAGGDPRLRIQEVDACRAGLALDTAGLGELADRIPAAEISRTAPAQAAVDASREAARLEAGSWKAAQDYSLYNARRQDRLDRLQSENPAEYARIKQQDAQQEVLNTGLALTREAIGAAQEQERQWAREAAILREMVDKLAEAERGILGLARDAAELARAGGEFGARAATQVAAAGAPAVGGVRRLCRTPATTVDAIAVDPGPGARAVGPLLLEARFDDGSRATLLGFPASPSSDKWLATVFWPAGAKSAEVTARLASGRPASFGRISAGRESLEGVLKAMSKNRKDAERKLREAKWLSKGGSSANSGVVVY
jgi:hypothetical protein